MSSAFDFSKGDLTKVANDSRVEEAIAALTPKTIGIYHLRENASGGGMAALLITDEEWAKMTEEFKRCWKCVGRIAYESA